MKKMKKIVAALLAAVLLAGTTACSTDNSWAIKTDAATVPIGAYIYYLYATHQSASYMVPDQTKPVLEQKIEEKDATSWIKEKSLDYTKSLLVLDNKMKELNLTITEDEQKQIDENTSSQWASAGPALEGFGVSKTSFDLANSQYNVKFNKVFQAMYSKGGSAEVTDAALKEYFEKEYTDFDYLIRPLYNIDAATNADGADASAPSEMTDEEKAAAIKSFDDYAAQISTGKLTMIDTANAYMNDMKLTTDPLQSNVMIMNDQAGFPQEVVETLSGMKAGEAKTLQITMESGDAYLLISKNDVTKQTDSYLKDEQKRSSLLNNLKGAEYSELIMSEAAKLSGVTVNENTIKSYDPSMFEKKS